MSLLSLLGCTLEPVEEAVSEGALPIEALWTTDRDGEQVTLGPVLVTSPRTTDGRIFFVSDLEGGPRSGAAVILGAVLDDWPPPVGMAVELTVEVLRSGQAPVVELLSSANGRVLGPWDGPAATIWTAPAGEGEEDALEDELEYALVTAADLTVTSRPDPLGQADSDRGLQVGGRFGVSPGYRRRGNLTGILEGGRISARSALDWTGALEGDPPLPASVPELAALPEGTPVILEDLSLATPWSRDARWAVAQDARGRGVWLDGEAWGLHAVSALASLGTWIGEVRHRDEGLVLRVWDPPSLAGSREAQTSTELSDGAIVTRTLSALSPPDALGERTAEDGLVVDDRFLDLEELSLPAEVVGAVRVEADGKVWLAPYGTGG